MRSLSMICAVIVLVLSTLTATSASSNLTSSQSEVVQLQSDIRSIYVQLHSSWQSRDGFAEKDAFETSEEYRARIGAESTAFVAELDQQLAPKLKRMRELHESIFATGALRLQIDENNYDANAERWRVSVDHLEHEKETLTFTIPIVRDQARALNARLSAIAVSGELRVAFDGKARLSKVTLAEPSSEFDFSYVPERAFAFSGRGNMETLRSHADGSGFVVTTTSMGRAGKPWIVGSGADMEGGEFDAAVAFAVNARRQAIQFAFTNYRSAGFSFKDSVPVKQLVTSNGGDYLIRLGHNVEVRERKSGRHIQTLDARFPERIANRPLSNHVGVMYTNNMVGIYDVVSGEQVASWQVESVHAMDFTPDGSTLLLGIRHLGGEMEVYGYSVDLASTPVPVSQDGQAGGDIVSASSGKHKIVETTPGNAPSFQSDEFPEESLAYLVGPKRGTVNGSRTETWTRLDDRTARFVQTTTAGNVEHVDTVHCTWPELEPISWTYLAKKRHVGTLARVNLKARDGFLIGSVMPPLKATRYFRYKIVDGLLPQPLVSYGIARRGPNKGDAYKMPVLRRDGTFELATITRTGEDRIALKEGKKERTHDSYLVYCKYKDRVIVYSFARQRPHKQLYSMDAQSEFFTQLSFE